MYCIQHTLQDINLWSLRPRSRIAALWMTWHTIQPSHYWMAQTVLAPWWENVRKDHGSSTANTKRIWCEFISISCNYLLWFFRVPHTEFLYLVSRNWNHSRISVRNCAVIRGRRVPLCPHHWWPLVVKSRQRIEWWLISGVRKYVKYGSMKYSVSVFVLLGTFICTSCLYEDQIGKFDW